MLNLPFCMRVGEHHHHRVRVCAYDDVDVDGSSLCIVRIHVGFFSHTRCSAFCLDSFFVSVCRLSMFDASA